MKKFVSTTAVHAKKAERYHASLCKHFARKVPVEHNEHQARVLFDMGICDMEVSDTQMHFTCEADSKDNLQVVQYIVGSHIIKFGELKDVSVVWEDKPIK